MNKSLTPLIIFFGLIILVTVVLTNSRPTVRESADIPKIEPLPEMKLSYIDKKQRPSRDSGQTGSRDSWQPDIPKMLAEAQLEQESGNLETAEDRLRTILVFEPDRIRALTMLGQIFYSTGRFAEAEDIFRKILILNPEDPAAMNNLGAALARMNRLEEAVKWSEKGFAIDPSSPNTLLNLAGIHSLSGETGKALDFFQKAYEKLGVKVIPSAYDPAFDNIREEPIFQEIVKKAEKDISSIKGVKQLPKPQVPQPSKPQQQPGQTQPPKKN